MVCVVAHGSRRVSWTSLGFSSSVGASDGRLATEDSTNPGLRADEARWGRQEQDIYHGRHPVDSLFGGYLACFFFCSCCLSAFFFYISFCFNFL
ncbi:hypothetical protein ACQJBY_055905 [Aegilops geniculata]